MAPASPQVCGTNAGRGPKSLQTAAASRSANLENLYLVRIAAVNWKRILTLGFAPRSTDAGLLVLRFGLGLSLFLKHGLEKLTGYSTMVTHFPDPIGVGPHLGLAYALFSDGICSLLVILGLGTRWAAAVIVFNLLVVFAFVHHMDFRDGHIEAVLLYIVGFLAILICGPGRLSLDHQIEER